MPSSTPKIPSSIGPGPIRLSALVDIPPGLRLAVQFVLSPTRRVTVVIADDSTHFRRGLHNALQASGAPIDVIGEAGDGREAVALVRDLQPDVILLDVRMPGGDGLSAAREIRAASPSTRVLMLTVSDSTDDIVRAARAGAAGYILKERSLEEVADAVLALARGQAWPSATG